MEATAAEQQDLIGDFTDEAMHALQRLPGLLESFRGQPDDRGPIDAAFRDIHSMKGCSAFLGLDVINTTAHSLENALEVLRSGSLALGEELQHALIEGFDLLDLLVYELLEGHIAETLSAQQEEVLQRVEKIVGNCRVERSSEELLLEQIQKLAEEMSSCETPRATTWARRMESSVQGYFAGEEARQTEEEGPLAKAAGSTPSDFVDVPCSCGGEDVTGRVASLVTMFLAHQQDRFDEGVGRAFLDDTEAFAVWAEEASQPTLAEELRGAASDFRTVLDSPMELDENLLSIIWERIRPELEKLKVPDGGMPDSHEDASQSAQESSAKELDVAAQQNTRTKFVRVKEGHLDEFVEHVSRLSITTEALKDLQSRMAAARQESAMVREMHDLNRDLREQTATLQQHVMSLRRVSVAGLFAKFPRMARTLGSNLGKKINVHISGEDTEIDKNVAEDLDAPLTHLIRNVADHGIETPQKRQARGASESGTLWLKAEQGRDVVRIIIQDDGQGIDANRLRAKAVEKGILARSQADALCDSEALNLIFHPGFSTAEKVSDVSGRGVGMDVVRTSLEKHNGEVTVESEVNVGTTICLKIPVRQATLVIDGLIVEQNGQQFVIPYEHIVRIAEIPGGKFRSAGCRRLVATEDQVYDASSLGELLDLGDKTIAPKELQSVVIVDCRQGTLCLLVDRTIGSRQVVVTSLKPVLPERVEFAGVAHLGNGHLVLVLNVPEVVALSTKGKHSKCPSG